MYFTLFLHHAVQERKMITLCFYFHLNPAPLLPPCSPFRARQEHKVTETCQKVASGPSEGTLTERLDYSKAIFS